MCEPEQAAQQRERAVHGRGAQSPLGRAVTRTDRADGREPLALVLADPARADLADGRVRAKLTLEVVELPPVLLERPLARLCREVTIRGLDERDATGPRSRRL